jgi:hypothetical protein
MRSALPAARERAGRFQPALSWMGSGHRPISKLQNPFSDQRGEPQDRKGNDTASIGGPDGSKADHKADH